MNTSNIKTGSIADQKPNRDDPTESAHKSKFAYLCKYELVPFMRSLISGHPIDNAALAKAIRRYGSLPFPAEIQEYLCLHLEEKTTKPKGRPAINKQNRHVFHMVLHGHYKRHLAWLRKRYHRYGNLEGWTAIQDANFWKGPPNEIAARMIARRFYHGAESYRRIQNIATEFERSQKGRDLL